MTALSGDLDILDFVDESVFVRDLNGRIRGWNKAAEALYGRTRDEAVGALLVDILKSDYPEPLADIEQTIQAAGRWQGEIKRWSATGVELTIFARCVMKRDASGKSVEIIETGRDISARKRAETALRYSEHRYHNLFQAMAASFWELDFAPVTQMLRALRKSGVEDFRKYFDEHPDFVRDMMRQTRVIDVNDQSVVLFGRGNKEELLGNVDPFWAEESTGVFAESILQSIGGKPNFSAECKLRKIDGTTFDALFTAAFPPETFGKGTLMVGVIDVTERKQAFDALSRSESRYRYLFDHMPISLWQMNSAAMVAALNGLRASGVTDLSAFLDQHPAFLQQAMNLTVVEEVNQCTVRLFGAHQASELYGPAERFWRSRPQTFRRILEARWRGELSFEEETQMNALDGRPIDGLFTVAFPKALTDLGISLNGFVDATERVRAQQMLQRVQADFVHAARVSMLGELTASIAHEVNQPLAAIVTNGQAGLRWLNRDVPNVGEVQHLNQRIVADAQRAAEIIARIRGMATRRETEMTLLSLNEIVQESVLFLEHELQSRHIEVVVSLAPQLPPARADRTQLQQVIANLTINAMQAIAHAESSIRMIRISTGESSAGVLYCRIADSGPGIHGDDVDRLFESFYTTKEGGLGMGLPICRSIIEMHGGRISAENASTAGGATFEFTLPADTMTHHTLV